MGKGPYDCKVDRITNRQGKEISRDALTKSQRRQLAAVEKRYTATVNRLMSLSAKSVSVASSGKVDGEELGKFSITRSQAAANLIGRQFSFGKPAANGGALETSGGWIPMQQRSNAVTYVTPAGAALAETNPDFFNMALVHDGALHGSKQEYSGTFGMGSGSPTDSGQGGEPFKTGHQKPYNDASCALLGVAC